MEAFKALVSERTEWKPGPGGQRSATYVFQAAGQRRELHFVGDGVTVSHNGARQNVPLEDYRPEAALLLKLGAWVLRRTGVSHLPFESTPPEIAQPATKPWMLPISLEDDLDAHSPDSP
jgi:hypothetical protein